MKQMRKRFGSLFLALAMMLTLLPVSALAAEEESTPGNASTVSDETSLTSAVTNAADGTETTITLGADITLANTLTIPAEKNIVLDLDGKTLSVAHGKDVIDNSGNLTVKNGTIATEDKGSSSQGMAVDNLAGATLTVEQDENQTTKLIGRSGIQNYGTVVVYNGTIESYNRNAYWGSPDSTLTVYDGSFTSTSGSSGYGRAISTEGDVTIYGGSFYAGGKSGAGDNYMNAIGMFNGAKLVIQPAEGKTVTVTSETDYAISSMGNAKLFIYGGTFACNGSRSDIRDFASGNVQIFGGSFKHEPYADYLADNRIAVLEDGNYVVKETTTTDVTVDSYEDLVNALNGSILEPKNVTTNGNITIPADANLTLQRGYALTVGENAVLTVEGILSLNGAMTNNGTLTVSDQGFIEYPLNLTNNDTITDYPVVKDGVCTVSSPMQLQWISYMVEQGQTPSSIQLAQDIVMPDVYFTPIGQSEEIPYASSVFDGAGKKITGLKVAAEGDDLGSLFGVTENVKISDLTLSGGSVTSTNGYIGALAGLMKHGCIVSNVHIKDYTVSSPISYGVGGFAGQLWTKDAAARFEFIGCTTENVTVTGYANVGGLWGTSTGSLGTVGIYNCDLGGTAEAINVNGGICGGYGASAPVEIIGVDATNLTATVNGSAIDKLVAYTETSANTQPNAASKYQAVKNENGEWEAVDTSEGGPVEIVATVNGAPYTSLSDAISAAQANDTIKLLKDLVLDQGFYIVNKPGITIDGDGHSINASASFTNNSYGQHNLMKIDSSNGVTVKNLTLITNEKAKHALDIYGSDNVILENVKLDHSAAENGAALVINQSKVTAKGSFDVVVGNNSWYGINIDDKGEKNSSALTFDSSVSFTFTDQSEGQNKEIIFVEPNTDPDTAVIHPENAGLVSNGDGTFDPAPISGSTSYAITVDKADNGTVTSSRTRANKGLTITLTVKADEGYALDTLTVTDKNGNEIKLTDKGDGKYTFTMPASAVTVKASFVKDDTPVDTGLPFTDVKADDWFYEAVKYVYDNKLMDGTSSTTFAPLMTTNRAMIVTILWRQAGSPTVDYTMNFTDVEDGVWYTEAVRWAAAEGVVKGYSDTVFAPNDTVTREQLAVILYRYAESKGYDMSAKGDLTTFTDGANTSSWATEAMEWAVGSGLLTGKDGGKLDPTGTATRAEVATILMRFVTENA